MNARIDFDMLRIGLARILFCTLIALTLPLGVVSTHLTAAAVADDHPASSEKPASSDDTAHPQNAAAEKAAPKSHAETAADRKAEDEDYEMYRSLADTIDQVERNYVKPLDRREIMEAAIKGILTKLDPYSSYISPEDINNFRTTIESEFGGIGIQITPDEGQVKVSSPLVGSPAYKAGVLAGDRIINIEGQPTHGLSLDEIVRKLKGEAGTPVTFTVRHALTGKEETFTINREVIHVDTVEGDSRNADDSWNFMLDPEQHIGYIRISSFSRDTADDLRKALETLKQQKMRGLVLDLRFNPGGLLTSAVDVCNMFIHEGRIVSVKGRNTPERDWDATPCEKFEGFPIVVLVNGYSASASEIVSACLQDHNRAVIVGERTWGKGSVQNVIDLEDGKSALKLTTATYTRPNGHNIHRFPDSKETDEWGVKPNEGMEVKLTDSEMAAEVADRHLRDMVQGHAHIQADDLSSEKSPKSAAEKNGSTKTAANAKLAPLGQGSKYSDRQMQKALEYLSTELARAQ